MHTLDITAANGTPFRVLLLDSNEDGPNPQRHMAGAHGATVEFYDRRYPIDGEHGQFTGGYYYLGTMLDHQPGAGLNLAGGVPAWSIDQHTFDLVQQWLFHQRQHLAS